MLREIIGELHTDRTWRILPQQGNTAASIDLLRQSGELIRIQTRPVEELDAMPSDVRPTAQHLIDQIKAGGPVRVTVRRMLRGGPMDHIKRQTSQQVEFPVGKPFDVPVDMALKILNRDIYNLVFMEVCDADHIAPPPPITTPPPPQGRKRS